MIPPKAIVFDLYGTLVDPNSVAEAVPTSLRGFEKLVRLWRSKQLEYSWLRSLMGRYANFEELTRQALEYALNFQGRTLGRTARARLVDAFPRVKAFPEVPGALARLHRKQRLAVFSNGTHRMINTSLRHAGLRAFFSQVLSVDPARAFKPLPRVYRIVLRSLRVKRAQVLFVSSNYWDAAGAQSFGFNACWVNRGGEAEDFLGVSPKWIVRELMELSDLLEE